MLLWADTPNLPKKVDTFSLVLSHISAGNQGLIGHNAPDLFQVAAADPREPERVLLSGLYGELRVTIAGWTQ